MGLYLRNFRFGAHARLKGLHHTQIQMDINNSTFASRQILTTQYYLLLLIELQQQFVLLLNECS